MTTGIRLGLASALALGKKTKKPLVFSRPTRERRADPTRTMSLTRDWEREFIRRWDKVIKEVLREVRDQDGFGLKTNAGRFQFGSNPQRVLAFSSWLSAQMDRYLFGGTLSQSYDEASDRFWGNSWANTAYRRGLLNAAGQIRRAGGTVDREYVERAVARGRHYDAIRQVHSRAFEKLRGITEEVATQIGDAIATQLGLGGGANEIVKSIVDRIDKIGKTRARLIARTEVISAYNEAELNVYDDAALHGVVLIPEWVTAGDSRVCERCKSAAERKWTIETARGALPLHPRCRCAWAPIIEKGKELKLL